MSTVSKSSEPQLDREALAALYEETFKNLEEGTITEGRVVALTKDKVVVDIGYKSEGMIPTDQFSHDDLHASARIRRSSAPVQPSSARPWRRCPSRA